MKSVHIRLLVLGISLLMGLKVWAQQPAKPLPPAPDDYLFEDTIRGQKPEEEFLWVEDSLDQEVAADLDSIDQNCDDDYVPKVSMAVLGERLAAIEQEIPLHLNSKVAGFIDYFTVRNRNYTQTMIERKDFYFPLFEKYLKKHNMPQELKYLSIVESGLKFHALSRAGALGLWQFMPGTGKEMGLKIDLYEDERMDHEKATEAACLYLKRLHRMFNDWELALASYNCGPGKVRQAMRRTGRKHFWEIYEALPKETRSYVPQFVAVSYAINYHREHNIVPDADSMLVVGEHDTVWVERPVSLALLAKHLDVEVDELRILNPTLKKLTTPHNRPFCLRLPKEVHGFFKENQTALWDSVCVPQHELAALMKGKVGKNSLLRTALVASHVSDSRSSRKTYHKVRKGESLFKVALAYGVTAAELRDWNHLRGNKVQAGQKLVVYQAKAPKGVEDEPLLASSAKGKGKNKDKKSGLKAKSKTYTVQPGDTLWAISQKFEGLSVEEIVKLNDLKDQNIRPGQKIIVG